MGEEAISARTGSAAETKALAIAFAGVLRGGDVVLLAGDLGAGKTTFTQGLAEGLGVAGPVTSPTFTLLRSYARSRGRSEVQRPGSIETLLHADLFRLDRLREVADLAIDELLDETAVAVVEWGDVAAPVLGDEALVVVIAHGAEPSVRILTLKASGPWEARVPEIREALTPWLAPPTLSST